MEVIRVACSMDGLGVLGQRSSSKDSVTPLAYNIVRTEKMLHGVGRALPPGGAWGAGGSG